jgi:signal transduction histidine kinase
MVIRFLVAPFRRLRFRLFAAYFWSCVGTGLVFALILASIWAYFNYDSPLPLQVTAQLAKDAAGDGIVTSQSSASLVARAQQSFDNSSQLEALLNFATARFNYSYSYPVGMAEIDQTGRILPLPIGCGFDTKLPLLSQVSPEEVILIQRVLHNSAYNVTEINGLSFYTFGTALSFRTTSGNCVAAAPIFGPNNSITGIVYLKSGVPLPIIGFFRFAIALVVPLIALLSFIPAVVFGNKHGGKIAKRLTDMTSNVTSWSEGNFAPGKLEQRSGDEIGSLAQKLNKLPEELRIHVLTRQKFATLEERTRVARNLHDTVKQQVFASAMQLGAARTVLENPSGTPDITSAQVFVSNAEKLINKAQEDLMSVIHDLKPETLSGESLSLVELIRISASDWSDMSGIPTSVAGEENIKGSSDVRQELLSIVHEALSNVARHSEATNVNIELSPAANAQGALQLTIVDNGRGFDPTVAPRGLGLRSMRDRATELPGGRFLIESAPAQGVAIRIVFLPGDQPSNG